MDKGLELGWIFEKLQSTTKAYTLASIIEHKPYSTDDVHAWLIEDSSLATPYGKIRDLLQTRILAAIKDGELDKSTGEGMLRAFYYKPFEQRMEQDERKVYTRMDKIVYAGKDLEFVVGNKT
jgi:hypothetical protein